MEAKRALIDWDYGAAGIWYLGQGCVTKVDDLWCGVSERLVADLRAWNELAESIHWADDAAWTNHREGGRRLARAVQDALGDSWQVLYGGSENGGWAWTWVTPPWDATRQASPS